MDVDGDRDADKESTYLRGERAEMEDAGYCSFFTYADSGDSLKTCTAPL